MAASWAVIWDSVCDFLHGKSQALSEGSAVKPAIRGSPTYSQPFTARLKSCPDTKPSFSAACEGRPLQKTRPGCEVDQTWFRGVVLPSQEQLIAGLDVLGEKYNGSTRATSAGFPVRLGQRTSCSFPYCHSPALPTGDPLRSG